MRKSDDFIEDLKILEETEDILSKLIELIQLDIFEISEKDIKKYLSKFIEATYILKIKDDNFFFVNYIYKTLKISFQKIEDFYINESKLSLIQKKENLTDIKIRLVYLYNKINNYSEILNSNQNNQVTNSKSYYTEKINELTEREKTLSEELNKYKSISKENEDINSESFTEYNKLIEENLKIKSEKEEINKLLETKKKEEDIKKDWETKIKETFDNLKDSITPIKNEKTRLNTLYENYLALSKCLLCLIFLLIIIAIYIITFKEGEISTKIYLTIYIPIPISGALLWGFIYQMNRAQRQLVVIAKSIHNIEYVQGLLLAINKLAPNFDDGIKRINEALDKLINNHLSLKTTTEEEIIKEESKDSLPVDAVIKLLKEIKDLKGDK